VARRYPPFSSRGDHDGGIHRTLNPAPRTLNLEP
jgi:hypothetical protein